MVQPFVASVADWAGEVSLVYFGGTLLPAIRKLARGDQFPGAGHVWRHGASPPATAAELAVADAVLAAPRHRPPARIDLWVEFDGAPALMEAELTRAGSPLSRRDAEAATDFIERRRRGCWRGWFSPIRAGGCPACRWGGLLVIADGGQPPCPPRLALRWPGAIPWQVA